MADAVHAHDEIQEEEVAEKAADQNGTDDIFRSAKGQRPESRQDDAREDCDRPAMLVAPQDLRIVDQAFAIDAHVGGRIVEQPAKMGDAQAFPDRHFLAMAVDIGAMDVTDIIGKSVMAAMVGCPLQHRSLAGHLRHDAHGETHFWSRFEGAVSEIAVIADADAHVDQGETEQKGRPFYPAGGMEDGPIKGPERTDDHRGKQYAIFDALSPSGRSANDDAMLGMLFRRCVIIGLNVAKCRRHRQNSSKPNSGMQVIGYSL